MDTAEFDAIFWLSVIGAVLGFGGLALKAALKSNCTSVKCYGFSCERQPGNTDDIDLEVPEFNRE